MSPIECLCVIPVYFLNLSKTKVVQVQEHLRGKIALKKHNSFCAVFLLLVEKGFILY